MNRREFIAGLGSAAAWPLAVGAQPAERVRRVGVLTSNDENDPLRSFNILRSRKRLLTWVGPMQLADGRSVARR
jgi:hypothetical protein